MPSFTTTAGASLHYEDAGAGAPLVLIHGWSLSSRALLDAVAPAAAGRRVVALDLRGHGRSAPAPFGLDELAGDVLALFERLGLEAATLLGWSLGAQVALGALPGLAGRVGALVLVSATPRFTACEGWPHALPARVLEARARHVERDAARAAARFFDGMFTEGELDASGLARCAALRELTPLPGTAALLAGLDVLATADLRAGLAAVSVPTLLVHGARDPVCPPGAAAATAAAIPRARLAQIPGAGHAPFLSRPEAFAAVLAPFLADPLAAASA